MPYNWWTFIRVIKKEKNRDYEEWVSDNKRGLHQKHCWWVHARKSPCCCRMCWWWDLEAGWSQPGKRRFQRPPLKLKKITAENEQKRKLQKRERGNCTERIVESWSWWRLWKKELYIGTGMGDKQRVLDSSTSLCIMFSFFEWSAWLGNKRRRFAFLVSRRSIANFPWRRLLGFAL